MHPQPPLFSSHSPPLLAPDPSTLRACHADPLFSASCASAEILGRVFSHAHPQPKELACFGVRIHHGETLVGKDFIIPSSRPPRETSRSPSPTPSLSLPKSTSLDDPQEREDLPSHISSTMFKKRRSLQTILVPPFFHPALASDAAVSPPLPSPRYRSHSAAASTSQFVLPPAIPIVTTPASPLDSTIPRNSPPSDLLDDDPFANLSPAPSAVMFSEPSSRPISLTPIDLESLPPSSPRHTPRSPLAQSIVDVPSIDEHLLPPWACPPTTPPSTPVQRSTLPLRRPKSSGHGQARPAYTRPAFTPRPSLPSLNTLAQMNVAIPRVKRGRVGAQLPAEPWTITDSAFFESPISPRPSLSRRPSNLSTIRDSRVLDADASFFTFDDETEEQDIDDMSDLTSVPDRSATPRASESSSTPRSTSPLSQLSIDPYPLTYIPVRNFDTHALHRTEDACSSPEPSFPPTPQLSANVPPLFDRSYSSVFSHQTRTSIYEDLSATLEYDYSHTPSELPFPPPTRDAACSMPDLDEGSGCDFEPGTSAQTVRRLVQGPSPSSHFRSSSSESRVLEELSHMDPLPLSPTTLSSDGGESSRGSCTSSDYDDSVDFLSYSSEEEEFITAPLSRSDSPMEAPSRLSNRLLRGVSHNDHYELSESSGADINARLSRLSYLTQSDVGSSRYVSAQEYVDSADDGYRGGRSQGRQSESGRQGESSRGQSSYSGYGYNSTPSGGLGGSAGGGGRRDRDGDDDRYRRPLPRQSAATYSDSDTSESEESEDEDEAPRHAKARQLNNGHASSSSADDVPLAQQIPTALKAQRTIRRQVRDEAAERRRAKSLRRPQTAEQPSVSPHQAPPELPVVAPLRTSRTPSVTRGTVPPEPLKPVGRPRTKTLPSQTASPFSPGELTKKLLGVQPTAPSLLPSPHPVHSRRPSQDPSAPTSPRIPTSRIPSQHEQYAGPSKQTTQSQDSTMMHRLRSMRSFHRPRTMGEMDLPPPVPSGGAQLGRSATSASRRHPDSPSSLPQPPPPPVPVRDGGRSSLERARSTRTSHSRRPSVDRDRSAVRPSVDQDVRPPMPPLPASIEPVSSTRGGVVKMQTAWQQRLFVGSLQRFCQVQITSSSTARDVLEILQNQGALGDGAASGWMVWEVSQDFGMERPIRSFEVLADVCNSWVADKTVNILMAKKTLLAPKLSRAAIPTSSPICSGFVQHEYKRGKWQKRWLELREHSLWLSKRDTGRDQIQLCSLSNFDAYIVTRVSKAPKTYVFAVKSTDNISFFESTSDYVHVFSCDQKEGENWLEKILLARSYVLYQERNVLSTASPHLSGAALSRSGTRKRPAQPLVNFGAAASAIPTEPPAAAPPPVFEPGSLLSKRS